VFSLYTRAQIAVAFPPNLLARALIRSWAHEFEVDVPRGPALRVVRAHMPLPIYGRVLDEDDAALNRQLHCRRYNECLNFAVRNDWPGFVCTSCVTYDPMDRDEFFQDVDAFGDLLKRMAQVSFTSGERAWVRGGGDE